MKKKKEFVLEQKHIDYFNSVIPELVEAEKTVHEIKNNLEWKGAINYFNICVIRNNLKYRPTKENHYSIELEDDLGGYFDFKLNSKYLDYFYKNVDRLIKAEEVIDKIKYSKEWIRTFNYFTLCHHRGQIKANPTKKNNYKIELINR